MTDMIAQDLHDMHDHPFRTVLAAIVTLLIILGCFFGCVFGLWSAAGALQ